ncbi:hypothetical protein [Streptomyces sp. A0958]|uniref:hypothetical protein n=1 Tax=Streptomyces sp. A0958 TaxID=2563101 RepID=UPI001F0F4988|nr:hypothetical protein [Streptomyces sp. A0958]
MALESSSAASASWAKWPRSFSLPAERDDAERITDELFAGRTTSPRSTTSPKAGASPPRRSASAGPQPLCSPGEHPCGQPPKITVHSEKTDEHYEGCLIHHETGHLDGLVYTARMNIGVVQISVEEYRALAFA